MIDKLMESKVFKGFAGGGIVGLCLAVPAAVAGWGAAVYYTAVVGAGLASSIGVASVAGGIVGGLVGATVLGGVAAGAAAYTTLGLTTLAGTAVGGGLSLLQKGAGLARDTFEGMKRTSGSAPKADENREAQPQNSSERSFLADKSVRKDFESSLKPNETGNQPPRHNKTYNGPNHK